MSEKILVSLCIPTSGVYEWVSTVVKSIYDQNISDEIFEVVITDNGTNDECKDKITRTYHKHSNLKYVRTNSVLFMNQIEAFKLASGAFIKFINHREALKQGALQYLIDITKKYKNNKEKPIIYFAQDTKLSDSCKVENEFNLFVNELSYMLSYSGGISIWKEDFNTLKWDNYNSLFPHTKFIFEFVSRNKYIIDYTPLTESISSDHSKKGNYNIYEAFAVEFMSIIFKLYEDGAISIETLLKVKNDLFYFVADCYKDFNILKMPHSYDTKDFDKFCNVFFDSEKIKSQAEKNIAVRNLTDDEIIFLRQSNVVVFGAGHYSHRWIWYLKSKDIKIQNVVVSDINNNPKKVMDIDVIPLEQLQSEKNQVIIIALKNTPEELIEILKNRKINIF